MLDLNVLRMFQLSSCPLPPLRFCVGRARAGELGHPFHLLFLALLTTKDTPPKKEQSYINTNKKKEEVGFLSAQPGLPREVLAGERRRSRSLPWRGGTESPREDHRIGAT